MKKRVDYENLRGSLLCVLAEKYATEFDVPSYLQFFGPHLEELAEHYRLQGNKVGYVRNMQLLEMNLRANN